MGRRGRPPPWVEPSHGAMTRGRVGTVPADGVALGAALQREATRMQLEANNTAAGPARCAGSCGGPPSWRAPSAQREPGRRPRPRARRAAAPAARRTGWTGNCSAMCAPCGGPTPARAPRPCPHSAPNPQAAGRLGSGGASTSGRAPGTASLARASARREVSTHYQFLDELGRGAFGTTHLVRERASGRLLACKSIDRRRMAAMHPSWADARREAAIMRRLAGAAPCHYRACARAWAHARAHAGSARRVAGMRARAMCRGAGTAHGFVRSRDEEASGPTAHCAPRAHPRHQQEGGTLVPPPHPALPRPALPPPHPQTPQATPTWCSCWTPLRTPSTPTWSWSSAAAARSLTA
jgi:hypothetical protein